MDEPGVRRLPWGQLVTLAALGLLAAAVFREAPARVALTAAAMAGAAFVAMRAVQNYLWGVVAALLLVLHPLHRQWSPPPFELALRAEAMELVVLAGVVAGCRLAALTAFAPWSWALTAAALVGGGALAWPALPQAGLVAALLTVVGLLGGAALLLVRHRERPAWGNVAAALLLAVAAPAAGLVLAPLVGQLGWPASPGVDCDGGPLAYLEAALNNDAAGLDVRGTALENLHRWAWPAVWVMLPLALWGLWCALRRGKRDWSARRPPLPWLLMLYAALDLVGVALHPRDALGTVMLPLASLAVLLAVFGVAEIARRLTRPLLLPPPEERQRQEAEGG